MKRIYLIGLSVFFSCEGITDGDGYVYDGASNQPIDGVVAKSYYKSGRGKKFHSEMITDSSGYFAGTTGITGCFGGCPDLVIELIRDGYSSIEIVNPNKDTVYLIK